MDKKPSSMTESKDDRPGAIAWLRGVLTSIADVAPLSPWIKAATCRSIQRLPNWILAAWAKALNIDYLAAYRACPDLAKAVRSNTGMEIVRQYLETRNVVPLASTIHQLARKVVKLSRTDSLPVAGDMVERQVCALAMANCTPQGEQFIQQASSILCKAERSNRPLVEYQILLEGKQRQKLERLDAALVDVSYSKWVAERIAEMKRWLGLEPPKFHVRYGERRPEWDIFWKSIFLGGRNEQ